MLCCSVYLLDIIVSDKLKGLLGITNKAMVEMRSEVNTFKGVVITVARLLNKVYAVFKYQQNYRAFLS